MSDYDQAERALGRLRRHITSLAVEHAEKGVQVGALLDSLLDPESHLRPVERSDGSKPANKPGSRPNARIDMLDLVESVYGDAVWFAYRNGWPGTSRTTALRQLPEILADVDLDEIELACKRFGIYVSTARTALAYQQPSIAHGNVSCPVCRETSIRSRPEERRAWCSNPDCPGIEVDDPRSRTVNADGRPVRHQRVEWDGFALYALLDEAARQLPAEPPANPVEQHGEAS